MNVTTQDWDPLLLYVLIKKLDNTTHTLYEQSLASPRDLQSLKGFLTFLEIRFQALEVLGNQKIQEPRKKNLKSTSAAVITTSCLVCNQSHPIYYCPDFLRFTPAKRLKIVQAKKLCINCFRDGHKALNCTSRGCKECSKKHNSLLHLGVSPRPNRLKESSESSAAPKEEDKTNQDGTALSLTTINSQGKTKYVLLSTAVVKLIGSNGKTVECRAVLDPGSQINLITERVVKKLGLASAHYSTFIEKVGGSVERAQKRVNVTLQSMWNAYTTRLEAYAMEKIISPQPALELNISQWPIPKNLKLADPNFQHTERVDLLLSAEHFYDILSIGQIKLGNELPVLQNTLLGWIVAGKVGQAQSASVTCGVLAEDHRLSDRIERFWKLEEVVENKPHYTSAEKSCEMHFCQTTQRTHEGRFMVRLPFNDDPERLGESKDIATRRFLGIERRLQQNPELKHHYVEFMNEYINLGQMQEIALQSCEGSHYFLPHHCVLKPDSSTTRLRVVFDASCKTSTNISLNDILHTGPTIHDNLFSILLRFRLPRYVFTADTQKMYRQIMLHPDDRKYQLLVWRNETTQPLQYYQLNTVTYGTTSAPYLATKCLQRLAQDEIQRYPIGANVLLRDFYVDDVMSGSNSLAEAVQAQDELIKLLGSAGMKLRKWCGSHPRLLQSIAPDDKEVQLDFNSQTEDFIKTLGLTWLDWDAALPEQMFTRWYNFRKSLQSLQKAQFPRHVFAKEVPKQIQLHIFCDASEKAYGAAVYTQATLKDGRIIVRLLCAKSRVAPIRNITIPRLELCAAKLGAELAQTVKAALRMEEVVHYFWSDSEIVLGWINSAVSSYNTFVANRISTIQSLSIPSQWRHVDSKCNPADVLSRGIAPAELAACNIWLYGPPFLHGISSLWSPEYAKKRPSELERKRTAMVTIKMPSAHFIDDIEHGNSFKRLQRITAYVLRFTDRVSKKLDPKHVKKSPSSEELARAMDIIVKYIQKGEFRKEIQRLAHKRPIDEKSPILSMTPFLNEHGILLGGGRLLASNLNPSTKTPILLPYKHPLTKLLITDIHQDNCHAAPGALLNITRQRFWPIKGKTLARSIVKRCIRCTRANPQLMSQIMGNLPPARVQPARPFLNAGVDFCGPLMIHYHGRGTLAQKSYIAIFCCFATTAVHLELLKKLASSVHSQKGQEDIAAVCSTRSIDFHFIPPRTPHFGGLWEAAVKSAKYLLRREIASASLTYEELHTLVVEVEAILNSRPITPLPSDPNDLTALTPGHFRIGEPPTAMVDARAEPLRVGLLTRWKLVSQIKHEFWRRWSEEYLNQLQHRSKWQQGNQNAKPGLIVIIKEDNTPVAKWPLGRIIKVYKGNDGYVRVADIKTSSGIVKRAIHRLAPLPLGEDATCEADGPEEEMPKSKRRASIQEEPEPSCSKDQPKRRRKGTSVISLLLACLLVPLVNTAPVNVSTIGPHPGIHFQSLGNAYLSTSEWKLFIYYDLGSYWAQFATLENGTNLLQQLCQRGPFKTNCLMLHDHFMHLQNEVSHINRLLKVRNKRGAFNIVGSVAKSLFGVLDEEYANRMSQTIKKIKGNQRHLYVLLKNQTSIIDSTLNIIGKSEQTTQQRFKVIEEDLDRLTNMLAGPNPEGSPNKVTNLIMMLSSQMTLITINLQRIQASIASIITDTQHGNFNPLLLSQEQLRLEISNIKEHLPDTLRFPTAHDNFLRLFKISSISASVTEDMILFKLKIQLVNTITFDLFRLYLIPAASHNRLVAILPGSRYLIISQHRDLYYPLTEEEYGTCTELEPSVHMCQQSHPLYQKEANISTCEVMRLKDIHSLAECSLTELKTSSLWSQIHLSSEWIYALINRTVVHMVCGGKTSTMALEGSGIIKMNPDCTLKSDAVTIQGHQLYTSTIGASYTRFHPPTMGSEMDIKSENKHPEYHQTCAAELGTLNRQLHGQELTIPNEVDSHDIHQYTNGYLSLLGIISLTLYLSLKSKIHQCSNRDTRPIPRPRRHSLPASPGEV